MFLKELFLIRFVILLTGSLVSKEPTVGTFLPLLTNRTPLILSKDVNVFTIAAICNLTVKSPPLPFTNASFTSTEAIPSFTVTDVISISLEKTGYFVLYRHLTLLKELL